MEAEYINKENEYPLCDLAITKILELFETAGYGAGVSHIELKGWMGITPAITVAEVKREQLDYLSGMEKVKTSLLEDYNLFLFSIQGQGYKILHPNEQVTKGAEYYFRKSQKALQKTMSVLANTDAEKLSVESKSIQLSKMNRVAFIKSAFRKRKILQGCDQHKALE